VSGDRQRNRKAGSSRPAPTFFTPPRQKTKRDGVKKSSEKGKVTQRAVKVRKPGSQAGSTPARSIERKFFVRQVELPAKDQSVWSGYGEHMPPTYIKGKRWSCPSCSVKPGEKHESWCPRAPFQSNPFNSGAYDAEDFLSRAGFAKQIWFGSGHPVKAKATLLSDLQEGEDLPF
jgi:hypothetical protein